MAEQRVWATITADTSRFDAAMRGATESARRIGERMDRFRAVIEAAFRSIYRLQVKPSRSTTVPPLCIDGHAYRRRTRSRQGRR